MAQTRAAAATRHTVVDDGNKHASSAVIEAHPTPPLDLSEEMGNEMALGTSGKADDNLVPFIKLLQDMNPEAKTRDPAYVKGAEPGCVLNTATRELWGLDDDFVVVPCAFERAVTEWRPNRGGFVARHPHTEASIEDTMRKLGGKQVTIKDDSGRDKLTWRNAEGNDLVDTRYHYVLAEGRDGRYSPVVIPFKSTGHQTSRAWMALMRNARLGDGRIPHSWFKRYRGVRVTRNNAVGDWFVFRFEDAGWIDNASVRIDGRRLYDAVSSGLVKAAPDEADAATSGDDGPI